MMNKGQKVLEIRERLNRTLALPDLVNEESIKSLVKDQMLRSPFCGTEGDLGNVVTKRTKEVANFLEMLRSASGNGRETFKAHGELPTDWKMKQDTEQLRVMYHAGLHGSPFHTLLAEGFADGPIDVCLCLSWESSLYKKWWPQYNIPTFQITSATCLQKVRIGEEISLVRVKVPWPVSDREALLHFIEIEYFQEDAIIVLINTISNTEDINVSTHGFSNDGIPEAKDTVRVDLVGGIFMQKVSATRSYFRMIANMDIKLDFMPPSLINFVSRQLIGNGHKLYQKAIASLATSDEDYLEALEGSMYARIRAGLDSHNKLSSGLEDRKQTIPTEASTVETALVNQSDIDHKYVTEIVEEESEHSEENLLVNLPSANVISNQQQVVKERAFLSLEVEHALSILDRAIAMVRGGGLSSTQNEHSSIDHEFQTSRTFAEASSIIGGDASDGAEGHSPEKIRYKSVDSTSSEANGNSSILNQILSTSGNILKGKPIEAADRPTQPPPILNIVKVCDEQSLEANGHYDKVPHSSNGDVNGNGDPLRKKKQRFCCLNLGLISR